MEIEFLQVEDVLLLHELQINAYGGSAGIRDQGLLESAVAMAQAGFGGEYVHADIFMMAAAYVFHIAENQPFVDGNKRAALATALTFLEINGTTVLDPRGSLYEMMIDLSAHKIDKAGISEILRRLATVSE